MWRTLFTFLGSALFTICLPAAVWDTWQKGDVWGCIICVFCVPLFAMGCVIYLRRWRWERRILRTADELLPAACSGDAVAQCRMADLYRELGMEAEAYRFYTAAAKGGNACAMFQLGVDLLPGVGAPCREDEEEGIEWLRRAYEAGDSRAAGWLARLYESGSSFTAADPDLAHLWRSREETNDTLLSSESNQRCMPAAD